MESLQKRNDDDDVVEVKKDRTSKKEKRTEEEKELRKEKKQIKKRVSCKLTHTSCRLTLNWLKDRDEVPAVEKRRKDEDKTIKISHHNGEDEERQRRYVRMSDVRIEWEAFGLMTDNIFCTSQDTRDEHRDRDKGHYQKSRTGRNTYWTFCMAEIFSYA